MISVLSMSIPPHKWMDQGVTMWMKFRNTNIRLIQQGLLLWLVACGSEVAQEPAGTPTPLEPSPTLPGTPSAQPTATSTASPVTPATALPGPIATQLPSPSPTASPEATLPLPTATAIESIAGFSQLTPTVAGQVFWQDTLLVDIPVELPACYPDIPAGLLGSPTETHFLLIVYCIEQDNQLFLFQADGSDKQRITGAWDYLNGENVSWADDSQSFLYERINSCCLELSQIPPDAPARGLVRYDIASGNKTLEVPWSPDGSDSPNLP